MNYKHYSTSIYKISKPILFITLIFFNKINYIHHSNNNYKNIFIADYLAYLKYEANGSLRLNKVTREILFNSCPFSKKYRETVYDNPQYKELINHLAAHNANVAKPLQNLEFRLKKDGLQVPHELTDQIEYLNK